MRGGDRYIRGLSIKVWYNIFMFSHACIKCQTIYKDSDSEAYLCSICNEQKKVIAAEIDSKMSTSGKTVISALQAYDNSQKVRGFVRAK